MGSEGTSCGESGEAPSRKSNGYREGPCSAHSTKSKEAAVKPWEGGWRQGGEATGTRGAVAGTLDRLLRGENCWRFLGMSEASALHLRRITPDAPRKIHRLVISSCNPAGSRRRPGQGRGVLCRQKIPPAEFAHRPNVGFMR